MNAQVLYEGNIQNNTCHQTAIYNLLERPGRAAVAAGAVEVYVNCVRIERVK